MPRYLSPWPKKKVVKIKKVSEHDVQKSFFNWLDYYPRIRRVSFAIPNGGARNLFVGKKLKAEGVTSGVPDCMIAIPMSVMDRQDHSIRIFHGLFIEFKVGTNKPSFNQRVWIKNLTENGYKCIVCYSVEAAQTELKNYLGELNGYRAT